MSRRETEARRQPSAPPPPHLLISGCSSPSRGGSEVSHAHGSPKDLGPAPEVFLGA